MNVSPDKRSIFLHWERNLVEALKLALEELFQPSRSTYNANAADLTGTGRTQSGTQRLRQATAPVIQVAAEEEDVIPHGAPAAEPAEVSQTEPEGAIELEKLHSARSQSKSRSVASADIDGDAMPLFRQETPAVMDLAQSTAQVLSDDEGQGPSNHPHPLAVPSRAGRANSTPSTSPDSSPAQSPPTALAPKAAMQMTLDTSGASWNLQPATSRASARKKAKLVSSGEGRQTATGHFRTFTAASVSVGSGAASATACMDDEEDEIVKLSPDERGSDNEDEPMQADDENGAERDGSADESLEEAPSAGPAEAVRNGPAGHEQGLSEGELAMQPIVKADSRKANQTDLTGALRLDLQHLRKRYMDRRRKRTRASASSHTAAEGCSPSTLVASRMSEELDGAGIDHEPEEAQKTLSRLVSKADFATMDVVGQFNVAFIIARRRQRPDAEGKTKATDAVQHDDLMIIE